jgi:hypothetical protein
MPRQRLLVLRASSPSLLLTRRQSKENSAMAMLDWNEYQKQDLAGVGEIARAPT